MLRLALPITALLAGITLLLLGVGLLNTLLPMRGALEGYSAQLLGVVMSCYFIGFLLGTWWAPRLIRRIGHIRSFACCAALVACTALLYVLLLNPWWWLLLRILTGAGLVVLYTAIESWLNGQSSREQRGQIFALYMMVNLVALALAQQLIRLAEPIAFTLFAISALCVTAALIPVTVTRLVPPPVPVSVSFDLRQIFRLAPVAAVASILSGLAMGGFWGLLPLYVQRLGFPSETIAGVMSVSILGGALLQYPLGRFSDHYERRNVIVILAAAASIAALFLAMITQLLPGRPFWLMVGGFIYGGFAFAVYPVAVAHLVDQLDQSQVLEGCSGLLFLNGVGAVFGPLIAGGLMTQAGAGSLPLYFALMQMALCIYAVYQRNRRQPLMATADNSGHYVPMLRTSPVVMQLHPDGDEA